MTLPRLSLVGFATKSTSSGSTAQPPPSKLWSNKALLSEHFAKHGHEFGAKDEEDYALRAAAFFSSGAPRKVAPDGVIRMWDPSSNTFGSYHPDGTPITLFKPDPKIHKYATNADYWAAQPG